MKLNSTDKAMFTDRGILCLKNLIPARDIIPAREFVFNELERLRLREKGKWQTKQLDKLPPFKAAAQVSQKIRHHATFDELIPQDLIKHLDDLAGLKLVAQAHPQILITPPQKLAWSVPHLGWHLDIASPSEDILPGIQIFVLLDKVAKGGGGTVAIAGSHRLHGRTQGSSGVHQVLKEDPVYASLFSAEAIDRDQFLAPYRLREVDLLVVEMCGTPGDVYLMDMRILHAPAINAAKHARIMLTQRFLNPKSV